MGLDTNYTEMEDFFWSKNFSDISSIDEDVPFNSTSFSEDFINSTFQPSPPSSVPPALSSEVFPLAAILSIVVASYLFLILLILSLRSCSSGHGLPAECCGLSESDTTCSDLCSDLCVTCSQCLLLQVQMQHRLLHRGFAVLCTG